MGGGLLIKYVTLRRGRIDMSTPDFLFCAAFGLEELTSFPTAIKLLAILCLVLLGFLMMV